ncbi:MAG: hypothetical protein ACYSUD_10345 [Planctomycetota bacterium]|jgi:hypothetical protein
MSHLLTAAEILGADDLPKELVECPEWGGHVYVRTFTGMERDAWEQSMMSSPEKINGKQPRGVETDMANARANLVSRTACDESGEPIFTLEQMDALGRKSAKALGRCFDVASRLNGLSSEDMDEIVKNSGDDQSADSGSV